MRAVVLACWLAGCSTDVVDLGKPTPDAAIDAGPTATICQCRVTCTNTGGTCPATSTTCGVDGYCAGHVGSCSTVTPCSVPNSMCVRAASSTLCTF